jgi:regulator of protease activity HflC (stomatin/prohibitin superfamily)
MSALLALLFYAAAGIIILGLFLVIIGLRVIKEYDRAIIFRLGKFKRIQGPGLFYLIPIFDTMTKVDLRVITVDVPKQDAITLDNVPVVVNAVIYYRIFDPKMAILNVEKYKVAIAQAAQTTLRSIIGQFVLDDVLSKKEKINNKLRDVIDKLSDPWGIKVESVETKEVLLPQGMQRAMAKVAEADREKKSRLIKALGELEATKKLVQAGSMIRKEPSILELRRMQMITEVGAEKNSTTVLMVPTDFLTAARSFTEWVESSIKTDDNDEE